MASDAPLWIFLSFNHSVWLSSVWPFLWKIMVESLYQFGTMDPSSELLFFLFLFIPQFLFLFHYYFYLFEFWLEPTDLSNFFHCIKVLWYFLLQIFCHFLRYSSIFLTFCKLMNFARTFEANFSGRFKKIEFKFIDMNL